MKFAIGVEFCGAGFCGWQSQPGGGAVQDAVEAAASAVAAQPVAVYAAGRTDAGVHAALLTAHFVAPVVRTAERWVAGMNAHLPAAVRVLWAAEVAEHFHARHSVCRRTYQYILQAGGVRPALNAGRVGFCAAALDIAAMQKAAECLLGKNDFSAFRASSCLAKTAVRTLFRLDIFQRGEFVVFTFCGDGFLHHQVRNIVGALVAVGRGGRPPGWVAELLAGGDRRLAAPTAAAEGLYFCGAEYPAEFSLPEKYRPPPLLGGGGVTAA